MTALEKIPTGIRRSRRNLIKMGTWHWSAVLADRRTSGECRPRGRNRMKRTLVFIIGVTSLTLLLLLHQPVVAAFSGFEGLGGTFVSDPRCTFRTTGEVICAVLGTDQDLYVTRTVNSGTTWSSFLRLGGTVVGDPSCTSGVGREVICPVIGTDQGLYVTRTIDSGSTWSGFLAVGGTIVRNPSCTDDSAG